jgi:hypothetical protein
MWFVLIKHNGSFFKLQVLGTGSISYYHILGYAPVLTSTPKMKAEYSSKTLVSPYPSTMKMMVVGSSKVLYPPTWCLIPENNKNLHHYKKT